MADIKASSNLDDNIKIPWAPLSYTVSTMHCITVSLAGGGTGLGSMWGRQQAMSMLMDAGFEDVEVREIETVTPSTTTTSRSNEDVDRQVVISALLGW
jgi:hypothetical protein